MSIPPREAIESSTAAPAEPAAQSPAQTPATPPGAARPLASTFWLTLWMGLFLVVVKLVEWQIPHPFDLRTYIEDVGVLVRADLIYSLVIGLGFQTLFWLLRNRPRLSRVAWWAFAAVAFISVVFAVVSAAIFAAIKSPLTYPLIYLADDPRDMWSSIQAEIRPWLPAALILGPLAWIWVSHRSLRKWNFRRTTVVRVAQVTGIILILSMAQLTRAADKRWSWYYFRRMAENPHWTLIRSCAVELFGGDALTLNQDFPREDLNDFKTVAQRAVAPAITHLPAGKRPKNVIWIVWESVGAQHLGLYKSPFDTTPNLRREAANSVIFDNFYSNAGVSASSCFVMGISTYTGLSWRQLTYEHPNCAGVGMGDYLKKFGYRTAYITSTDASYANIGVFLHDHGLDTIMDCRDLGAPMAFSWGVRDQYMYDTILRKVDADPAKPFFIMGWTGQTHHPYARTEGRPRIDFFKGATGDNWALGNFLNCVVEEDEQLERLFEGLRARHMENDTLVVITGDHGEGFGSPHPVWNHGTHVFEENDHVPCILWCPGLFAGGRRIATVGGHVDLLPTVADCLALAPPDGSWQGSSMFDPARPPRVYTYAADYDWLLCVREGDLKYIYNATLGHDELYDLAVDPDEQRNIAADHKEFCARQLQRLSAWVSYQREHMKSVIKP